MPHDRLYCNEKGDYAYQSVINIKSDENGNEILEELKEDITDKWCKLYIDLWNTMPALDHVTANKRLKQEGLFKRLADMITSFKHKDSMNNNIFIPTRTL